MTAVDDRATARSAAVEDSWEWHEFGGGDGWAHLYLRSAMRNQRLEMLLPWCLRAAPFPLEHDRPSISRRKVIPVRGRTCPVCASQNEHRQIEVRRARS